MDMMDTKQALQEIDELFGRNWFREAIEIHEEVGKLSLEEQIDWVRNCSIHGQTYFFRDTGLLPILEHVVIPSFERRPISIASVGCSDGKEVYSILIYFWNRKEELILQGYDSNQKLIEEARTGGEGIPRNSKGNRINSTYFARRDEIEGWKHFGAENVAYLVTTISGNYLWADLTFTEQARKKVRFNVHDITKCPLSEKYDVIVLQNVLCHYAQKGRERIIGNVNFSLAEDGWLMCERYNYGSANATKEYDEWMKNLSKLGFIKQTTVIPTWYSQNADISGWSRVYRKTLTNNSSQQRNF